MDGRSFLKWAGGKTRSAPTLIELQPPSWTRYVEPFCGSAAVFFALRPNQALLSDLNLDLIVAMKAVQSSPEALMARLDELPNTREDFERIRAIDPNTLDAVDRAARMVYLNKTAFRGLWRVNKSGQFNAPYGDYDRPYYNRDTLLNASAALEAADIRPIGFREALEEVGDGDWVYLDPPYVPDREWGDFTRYTPGQFGGQDHEDLAKMTTRAIERGAQVLLTNSDMPQVRELYADLHMAVLPTRRDIAMKRKDRPSADLVAASYALQHPDLIGLDEWDAEG